MRGPVCLARVSWCSGHRRPYSAAMCPPFEQGPDRQAHSDPMPPDAWASQTNSKTLRGAKCRRSLLPTNHRAAVSGTAPESGTRAVSLEDELAWAAALFAAHLAFIAAASLARPSGVKPPFLFAAGAGAFSFLAARFLPRAIGLFFFADRFGFFADAFNFSLSLASFFVSFSILVTRRRIFLPRVLTFIKPQAPMFVQRHMASRLAVRLLASGLSCHAIYLAAISPSERWCISFLCRSQMRRP